MSELIDVPLAALRRIFGAATMQQAPRPGPRWLATLTTLERPGQLGLSDVVEGKTAREVWQRAQRLARIAVWESITHGDPLVPHVILTMHRVVERQTAPLVAGHRAEHVATWAVSEASQRPTTWVVEFFDGWSWHNYYPPSVRFGRNLAIEQARNVERRMGTSCRAREAPWTRRGGA